MVLQKGSLVRTFRYAVVLCCLNETGVRYDILFRKVTSQLHFVDSGRAGTITRAGTSLLVDSGAGDLFFYYV